MPHALTHETLKAALEFLVKSSQAATLARRIDTMASWANGRPATLVAFTGPQEVLNPLVTLALHDPLAWASAKESIPKTKQTWKDHESVDRKEYMREYMRSYRKAASPGGA